MGFSVIVIYIYTYIYIYIICIYIYIYGRMPYYIGDPKRGPNLANYPCIVKDHLAHPPFLGLGFGFRVQEL